MLYCINPDSDEPIFLIDCQIGRDDAHPEEKYIDGPEFVRELLYMDGEGKKRIQIWINSPGGKVTQGMGIYGAILNTKTKIDTFCYGIAYSIAGVIFQAGRKRRMADYATLMYHQPFDPKGDAGAEDPYLKVMNEAIATMISGRSWKDPDSVKKMMSKETFITAQEALDSGLCDEVDDSGDLNVKRSVSIDAVAKWHLANELVNKILPKEHTMNKAQICKLLNLDPSVSDEFAMKKLEEHLNKVSNPGVSPEEKKALEEKAAKAEAEAKAAKEALEAANKKAADEVAAKEKAEKEAKRAAAKERILNVIRDRGHNFDQKVIDNYVNMAGADGENVDAVIETIEAIPSVKKSVKFEASNSGKDEGFVVGKDGGVMDTTKVANYVNSVARKNASNRFPVK